MNSLDELFSEALDRAAMPATQERRGAVAEVTVHGARRKRRARAIGQAVGTLAVAGIHLSDIPFLDYQRHLFRERTLTSVTANTRADGEELLRLARERGVRPAVRPYPFDRADEALEDLARDRVVGAAVLVL